MILLGNTGVKQKPTPTVINLIEIKDQCYQILAFYGTLKTLSNFAM